MCRGGSVVVFLVPRPGVLDKLAKEFGHSLDGIQLSPCECRQFFSLRQRLERLDGRKQAGKERTEGRNEGRKEGIEGRSQGSQQVKREGRKMLYR